jgi:hypothetical protein
VYSCNYFQKIAAKVTVEKEKAKGGAIIKNKSPKKIGPLFDLLV